MQKHVTVKPKKHTETPRTRFSDREKRKDWGKVKIYCCYTFASYTGYSANEPKPNIDPKAHNFISFMQNTFLF
jgi:hypothetical protein